MKGTYCNRCGLFLEVDSLAHFCNAKRFCENCGRELPIVLSNNFSHKCIEEKIEITKTQFLEYFSRGIKKDLSRQKVSDGRITPEWVALEILPETMKELGFKE